MFSSRLQFYLETGLKVMFPDFIYSGLPNFREMGGGGFSFTGGIPFIGQG